jgi:hypothetical protein
MFPGAADASICGRTHAVMTSGSHGGGHTPVARVVNARMDEK